MSAIATAAPVALAYLRVSSEEQADSGLGLDAQRERIRAYCTMKVLTLAGTFEDPGVSGGKPLAARPSGAKLLAAARKAGSVVVVAKLDRLFRSVADAAGTIAEFERRGIQLVSIAEGFDMTSIYGRAMAQMASVFAELERGMIRERTKSALGVKRARGERISRHAPYGWDFGPEGEMAENAGEQETLATMRQLAQDGLGFESIAEQLNGLGIRPKRAQSWARATVRGILRR